MTNASSSAAFPRREFLKAGGALLIGFAIAPEARAQPPQPELIPVDLAPGPGQPDPDRLDTWIAVHADNTATIFFGYVDLGQGIATSILQIAAEELDLGLDQVKTVRVETGSGPNQGNTGASSGINRGGPRIRLAAAEARQALLRMASTRLGAPVDRLTVSRGVVSVAANPAQSVTYGQLIGDRHFDVPYTGTAPIKDYRTYKIVGTSVPRVDMPDKASGAYAFMQHVRLPGMLHGRVVRPRGQGSYADGARVTNVDAASIRDIPGARVIRRGDFLGVMAPSEWSAVQAAQRLRVTWDLPAALPATSAELFERMRAAKTIDRKVLDRGDTTGAFAHAAHVASGRFDSPYQAHAPFAPSCAVADVKADSALVMCSSQGVYGVRPTIAALLKMPLEKVTVQFYQGAGSFGHACFNDAAQAAAVMSQEAGAPVRVQFMRWDEHGWDFYQPAHTADVKIAMDSNGKLLAYEYHGWHHTWSFTETTAQLAAGQPVAEGDGPRAQALTPFNVGDMYAIPNWRIVNHRVPGMKGYLKGGNLRSPLDVAISFGAEQVIDDLAYTANLDPYLFRRQNISDDRWLAVLDAVAKAANWTPRKAAANLSSARVVTGRGIGLGTHLSSYGAAVAEIEVDKQTGVIVAKRMYGALEAGQAINPGIIESQISGMMVQAASRVLKEEVKFSATNVSSVDWVSYPMLRFGESPEVTAIVVKRQDQRPTGAGEEALASGAAAIANAFFDATGVRLREHPMTPARVLSALKKA
ncbi:MAG TPA: molybdopterin cofactor-binding domain-containing protein [Bryobacteraceae bacterium]|nr:molybdopterin cofactor-binding domain-containing protein [Bryobacteraceae bacterium]